MMSDKITIIKMVKNIDWGSVPLELIAFMVFGLISSAATTLVYFFAPRHIYESITPIAGWGTSNSINFLTAFFTLILCIQRNIKIRDTILVLLGFNIAFDFVELIIFLGNDYQNPYLMLNKFRPIWTMVVPSVWIFVLLSPRVKRYCVSK